MMENTGRDYPDGIFYRRACEMMGIDPDNNPNYETDGDNVIIPKEQFKRWRHNNMAQLTEHMFRIVSDL